MASLSPYLKIKNAAAAMDFYKRAFGAVERTRLTTPDGTIVNAEMHIGGAELMLTEDTPDADVSSPSAVGTTSVILSLRVDDVDAVVQQAVAAGAKIINPVSDEFYGWRDGRIIDPFGHVWIVGTKIEDVTGEEMQRRMDAQ